jgi:hypothetical protein
MVHNKPHTLETKEIIRMKLKGRHLSKRTEFKKGRKMFFSEEHKRKLKLSKTNEKNPLWKGDAVGNSTLHQWIRRHKPKPLFCVRCNIKPPYDVSNISGKYLRDVNDFEWLCRSCHMKKDNIINNITKNKIILMEV